VKGERKEQERSGEERKRGRERERDRERERGERAQGAEEIDWRLRLTLMLVLGQRDTIYLL
jgi:hypothetical protein